MLASCGGKSEVMAAERARGVDLTAPLPSAIGALDPRTAGALQELFAAVEAAPRDAVLRRSYASMLDAIQCDAEALTTWRQALAIDPKNATSHHHLGRLLSQQRKFSKAAGSFLSALELQPDYAPTHWRLGLVHLELDQYEKARVAFARAQELAPRDPSGATGLALVALETGEPGVADEILSALLLQHPRDARISEALATANRRLGIEATAALVDARAGRETRCFRADIWERELSNFRFAFREDVGLARQQLKSGNAVGALGLLEPIYAEDPDYLEAEGMIVHALLTLNQVESARTILRQSLERGDHPSAHLALGIIAVRSGDNQGALDRAMLAGNNSPGAHFLRARALLGLERRQECVTALKLAFQLGEQSLQARMLYGRCLADLADHGAALAAVVETTDMFPASLEAWALRVEVEVQQGLLDDARQSLAVVTALDGSGKVLLRLGVLFDN
ncbi:MAG: tetratricopeptide (TPR) repeat protein [Planctomycetota bacterium]|jgi:tetratricopeptide (TPR) repeat protein